MCNVVIDVRSAAVNLVNAWFAEIESEKSVLMDFLSCFKELRVCL